MDSLPPELVCCIFEQLNDRETYANLMHTCWSCYVCGNRHFLRKKAEERFVMELLNTYVKARKIDLTPFNAKEIEIGPQLNKLLYEGAHLAVGTSLATYFHHGIVTTKNEDVIEVVHVIGDNESDAIPTQTSLHKFLDKRPLYLVEPKEDDDRCREYCAVRARYYAGNPEKWDKYHAKDCNCEHFANYCRTGVKSSGQATMVLVHLVGDCSVVAAKLVGKSLTRS